MGMSFNVAYERFDGTFNVARANDLEKFFAWDAPRRKFVAYGRDLCAEIVEKDGRQLARLHLAGEPLYDFEKAENGFADQVCRVAVNFGMAIPEISESCGFGRHKVITWDPDAILPNLSRLDAIMLRKAKSMK